MKKVHNKEELQSYILQSMKDNSSVLEKKIFYNIVKLAKHLTNNYNKDKSNTGSFDYLKISLNDVISKEKENISLVKEALLALQTKEIWFEEKTQEGTKLILLSIIASEIEENQDETFLIFNPVVWDCMCSMTEEQIKIFDLE